MEAKPFSTLSLKPELLQALDSLDFKLMTPIQAASLPPILEGRDVIGQARTGSGKTAAYGLGLLSRIDPLQTKTQALVLCPTRELADQISKEIRRLARCMPNVKLSVLSGGIAKRPQLASLEYDPHIVVGMAGRVLEHIELGTLKLDDLRVLVLDEADRMLDSDFEDVSRAIVDKTPRSRQTLFFSATFPDAVRGVSRKLQKQPEEISIDNEVSASTVEQTFFEVDSNRRMDALAHLLTQHRPESALVFCHTKKDAQEVESQLAARGYSVLGLHGNIEQRERDEVLVRFTNGSCRVLVATDVAARGLDIKELAAVISYELPEDADLHVHRVGRTGRAGRSGLALHLFTPRERSRLTEIEQRLGIKAQIGKIPMTALLPDRPVQPFAVTLCVDGGRSDKLRPGDLLGALTGDVGVIKEAVGKISTFDTRTYFAIDKKLAKHVLQRLRECKIKGKKFRVREID
ncbi:ATP-dependent RNA helicase DbpA [Stenotrophobium rhamnosiphilum]|uniref:ATP-dependent RNA helicase DbpA n=1 Tax=Stenotrophobium rhamnosiphilum TaxID=2029166 RepID=A0A2T5MF26_9GAMM|nr:ATP-dependent RNA helicase DbpA [Stenotrophobium rhamnosiphilum]PTU31178.1 ATP-dependent RNA helicase DbpA [Stenotrophobium rhamnosiphilum]